MFFVFYYFIFIFIFGRLVVHGRTKDQVRENMGVSDWNVIALIKENAGIPIIANGDVNSYDLALKCLEIVKKIILI